MQSIMKALIIIAAMLILAMILKAIDSLTGIKKKKYRIDLNNTVSVQKGLAHYKDLED